MGVHPSMAKGAPPSNLGQPMSRCVLCSSVPGKIWSSENAGQTSKKGAASLGPGHPFTEVQGGEGAALGSHGKSDLQTTGPSFTSGAGLVGAVPSVLTLPLSPSGYIRAAGPGVGVCAYLRLLRGESAPGASGQAPLGLDLGPNWWW